MVKLFLLQIFRLRESYLLALPLGKGPDFTCSGRDEKSREPAHACRGMDKSNWLHDRTADPEGVRQGEPERFEQSLAVAMFSDGWFLRR